MYGNRLRIERHEMFRQFIAILIHMCKRNAEYCNKVNTLKQPLRFSVHLMYLFFSLARKKVQQTNRTETQKSIYTARRKKYMVCMCKQKQLEFEIAKWLL